MSISAEPSAVKPPTPTALKVLPSVTAVNIGHSSLYFRPSAFLTITTAMEVDSAPPKIR
jgi:hypothetical protein